MMIGGIDGGTTKQIYKSTENKVFTRNIEEQKIAKMFI